MIGRGRALARVYALEDFEPLARRHLPRPIFGYVAGAAETNASLADNRAAFAEIGLLPRVGVDVSGRSLSTRVMGLDYDLPFGIAPMGVSALTAYRGDLVLARAAPGARIPMIVSAASLIPLEEITAEAPDVWYQAYFPQHLSDISALLDRVARAGVETLVVTLDSAVVPSRENNLRSGYRTPIRPNSALLWQGITHPRWALGTFLRTYIQNGPPHFENATATRGAPLLSRQAVRDFSGREFLSWELLAEVRKLWKGRLVLKGILHPDDVARAKALGAQGVILSNHGGRQLDGAVAPLRVLGAALERAGDMAVMIDGGILRGTDILKAMALGAAFTFLGRPMNYAAAVAGEAGVAHTIELMRTQLRADLGMLGVLRLEDLSPSLIHTDGFRAIL
ncbi:alpha-hydroxy acid oxidase [Vannielia litorea]|uniref:alpha-hydroxy acid oxidase n=1 Tax=Vannielia litorea TaxID=1217970 RepID=UPI001C9387D5|nr:alpha-hydroxy acid oxidase [Vannielia litorea]MBY6047874.1 alpha-hydroxy-acid oxidizing protein [Vannielia litorea]MBY6075288.1 alpha-hydroxy-acid oxidizing protein [Vannielia litorea]